MAVSSFMGYVVSRRLGEKRLGKMFEYNPEYLLDDLCGNFICDDNEREEVRWLNKGMITAFLEEDENTLVTLMCASIMDNIAFGSEGKKYHCEYIKSRPWTRRAAVEAGIRIRQ